MAKKKLVKGYISAKQESNTMSRNWFKEQFKGEVSDIPVRFPKELGAKHPYNFADIDKLCKKYGVVAGMVNKITDSVIADFMVKLKNPNAQALIDSFIEDSDFKIVLRDWVKEAIKKGNGFMEMDLNELKVQVMNANNMYVQRDKKGKVLRYNQFTGDLNKFKRDKNSIVPFDINQIAHLQLNLIPGEPYGIGYIWPNERIIENIVKGEQDKQKLVERKAGAPMHVRMGQPGEAVNSADIDSMSDKLKYLTNKTEWVTDGNTEIKVVDFGEIGKNITDSLMYDFRMLLGGMEMPEVLMGSGQLNEGIAKVQLEGHQRRIRSIQLQVEIVLEEKVFRPILRANNLDEKPQFIWNLPGEEEINKRLEQLNKILQNFNITENMKRMLQLEIARLLEIEGAETMLQKPEKGADEREEEEEIPQPEVPGAKPTANEKLEEKSEIELEIARKNSGEMTLKEFVNLKEIAGFNYTDFIVRILRRLNIDKFEDLRAISEGDISNGLLPEKEIEKLRVIFKDGFKKNKTVKEIESEIKENIELKDRQRDGKILLSATARPNAIARTETVRLANMGLKDLYSENKIERVRFLAALSDRTCPICESLNGRVFNINELNIGASQPPIHVNCRCSLIGIVE
jgi:SPP1 gp7 family putative phage head morphogenesis protein